MVRIGRCDATRSNKCRPCGESHRRRLQRVMVSGTEVDDLVPDQPGRLFWCTITAPGQDRLPWDPNACRHAPDVECSGKLGCQVDGLTAAAWNGFAPRRWSWFVTYVRRLLGDHVEFAGSWEWQERGVLHRHFLLRTTTPRSTKNVRVHVRSAARRWGFGTQFDVVPLTASAHLTAWYAAKYSSKTADDMDGRQVLNPRTGELLASRGFRPWSCSRKWGDSMGTVRARQRAWWLAQSGTGGGGAAPVSGAPGDGAAGALDPNSGISTPEASEALRAPRDGSVSVLS